MAYNTGDLATIEMVKLGCDNVKNYVDNKVGATNGIASLGADGKVPSSQLPSYVDDVIEASSRSAFPTTGEAGKIYIALDTNKAYRWSGSTYVEITSSDIQAATSTILGGIKTGYTQSGRDYPVELDSNNNAYVHVPWTEPEGANWNETDTNSPSYIRNKPTIPKAVTASDVSGWGFIKGPDVEFIGSLTMNKTVGTVGSCSVNLGDQNVSSGDTSVCIGFNLRNDVENKVSIGQYNYNDPNSIFEIGCGTSEATRKNAMSIDTNGEVTISKLKGYNICSLADFKTYMGIS